MRRNRLVWLLVALPLLAWGPHPNMVDAALAVLPAGDRLGAETGKLREYVWMGDWKDSLPSGGAYYANDFLIFPDLPRHYGHLVPEVTNTYRPLFPRALAALRTETAADAARWIGSLLHFTTDTGAPPHAAGISGDLHSKMENWIDGTKIQLPGYTPRLLGKTDEEALQGYLDRMNGLIEFSRQRAARARPLIEAGDRAAAEPVILESGIESAKVAADVLHTLLVLSAKGQGSARLRIELEAPSVKGLENIPARLLLLGTNYSTTSDAGPALELRNLPAGTYTPVVYRTGCRTLFAAPFDLKAGADVRVRWRLEAGEPEGNLVRNPDFRIRWSAKNRPEHWDYQAPKGGWVSDNIPVVPGKPYRAVARAKSEAAKVSVQWMQQTWQVLDKPIELAAPETVLTAPPAARYAKLIVAGREDPATALESVALIGQ